MKKLKMKSNESHTYKIINISRWAMWIVFVIELNLWLPCFGLSALYLPTPDPTLPAGPASLKIQRSISCYISANQLPLGQCMLQGFTHQVGATPVVLSSPLFRISLPQANIFHVATRLLVSVTNTFEGYPGRGYGQKKNASQSVFRVQYT